MKRRVELTVAVADDQGAGDRLAFTWTGRHGLPNPTAAADIVSLPMFALGELLGKGYTPKGYGGKGAIPATLRLGKGELAKGIGPKGRGVRVVTRTILVSPVTGLRTCAAVATDIAENPAASSPETTAMLAFEPARPGGAALSNYNAGTDLVTLQVGDRMY